MKFLMTRDPKTKEDLVELGFKLLSEKDGMYIFLNECSDHVHFHSNKVVVTDKLMF